jgi:hypothetical protein
MGLRHERPDCVHALIRLAQVVKRRQHIELTGDIDLDILGREALVYAIEDAKRFTATAEPTEEDIAEGAISKVQT